MMQFSDTYDVVIIGAGHAGCEAALACARMGHKTLLATLNLDSLAMMPCNPAIGGTGKGHLVRELDALGGEMGRAIDDVFIQSRMLNTGKAPPCIRCARRRIRRNTRIGCVAPWMIAKIWICGRRKSEGSSSKTGA